MQHPVVAYRCKNPSYPQECPFLPNAAYPESPFPSIGSKPNEVYAGIRECFKLAGLDQGHFGSAEWNPLGEWVHPGDFVLIKPNMIKEQHPRYEHGWNLLMTHGSFVTAMIDYVVKAQQGRGRIMIADAPQTDSSFQKIIEVMGFDKIVDYYRNQGVRIELVDLRQQEWRSQDGVVLNRRRLSGDPEGYQAFDLASNSEFSGHRLSGCYYGADYDTGEVNRHHSQGRHEYLIAGSAAKCDVFINLPKLKTHKKTGITVSLKNLVGINGDKNWLPHHTEGFPGSGGDQFPALTVARAVEYLGSKVLRKISLSLPRAGALFHHRSKVAGRCVLGDTEQVVRNGNWHGNDTTWRMVLDLNKLLLYGNADGSLRPNEPRSRKRYLTLVDGIVAGEGAGPMNPDPVPSGLILFGANPASVDAVAAGLMGFDPDKIPVIRQAFSCKGWDLSDGAWSDTACVSNVLEWQGRLRDVLKRGQTFHFRPHFGWTGHIERDDDGS